MPHLPLPPPGAYTRKATRPTFPARPPARAHQRPRSHGMMYVEASAKTAANVAEVFEGIAAKLAGGLPVSSNAAIF